ncbi:DUF3795 domain-containing protein [Faecalibacterium sp. An192]|uniref:DUF3795 domain-containing protein n=1 Tax=Faecalibacterium sp. An192 TaxID=1965581 RepID=UPI000B3A9F0E|nr:DUF3795 domain-containing protein [Faecalibacterium sp. An192]OUP29288.1 hypothetical protein B5F27_03760 [Faecalibacterium sp. An192]
MRGFERTNPWLSLCGLNCGLCPMRLGDYCGGCGHGNQSCPIARCSLEQGKVEYCFACSCYPCEKYQGAEEYDSFITHRRQMQDLEKAQRIGLDAYNREQQAKAAFLQYLLEHFNDGRRKTLFCVAVNLLDWEELQEAAACLREKEALPLKEKALFAAQTLGRIADRRGVELKLRKKK